MCLSGKKEWIKTGIVYLSAAAFCVLFQLIYGIFSHGVSSGLMTFAFVIPLAGGMLACVTYGNRVKRFSAFARGMIMGGVIWLTLGCLFGGALQIYGTTNSLMIVFWIVGGVQIAAALGAMLLSLLTGGTENNQ